MKNKIKKTLSVLAALAMTFVLFANVTFAGERTITKYTTGDSTGYTHTVKKTGYKVYNTGSSGYIQYNQVETTTGHMPFGTPTVSARSSMTRALTDVIDGTYYFRLTGTGTGYGTINYE